MTEFPVYQPSSDSNPSADPNRDSAQNQGSATHWYVLVEYSRGGQAKPPTQIEDPFGRSFSDLQAAVAAAENAAFEFRPPDPFSPQGRKVYQTGQREFLTVIDGMTSTFHFTTRVAQYRGQA